MLRRLLLVPALPVLYAVSAAYWFVAGQAIERRLGTRRARY